MPTAIVMDGIEVKRKVGRPEKYKKEFCEIVIELGKQGYAKDAMAAKLEIAHDTFNKWRDKHPEFAAAVTRGNDMAYIWWTEFGRNNMKESRDDRTNDKIWALNMMNRFGWNKKEDITSGGEKLSLGDITIEMQRRSTLYSPANVSVPQLEQGGTSRLEDARN